MIIIYMDLRTLRYGARAPGERHLRIYKPTTILSNAVLEGLSKKCSGRHNHRELSGKVFYKGSWGWGKAVSRTKLAARYPTALCRALAQAVRKSIA